MIAYFKNCLGYFHYSGKSYLSATTVTIIIKVAIPSYSNNFNSYFQSF